MPAKDKMTASQRKQYEELQEKIAQLSARQRKIVQRASVQKRKDDTRRKIAAGGLLLSLASRDEQTRKYLYPVLREGVEENQRYLFPEIWPDAERPARKREKQTVPEGSL